MRPRGGAEHSKPPYDKKEVRWALALATDIQGVSMATFNGMLRVSPLPIPPTWVLQKTYMFPMKRGSRAHAARRLPAV